MVVFIINTDFIITDRRRYSKTMFGGTILDVTDFHTTTVEYLAKVKVKCKP